MLFNKNGMLRFVGSCLQVANQRFGEWFGSHLYQVREVGYARFKVQGSRCEGP